MQKKKPSQKKITKQKKKPLNSKEEDLGLKTADEITEVDDLQQELGRLRTYLEMFNTTATYEGMTFSVMVDPLNRTVSLVMED